MTAVLRSLPSNVVLLGVMDHSSVIRELCASDIFFFPTTSEGFPNVILEAMAVGLPVVSTRVGAIPEIIEHGTNGILVDRPQDPRRLAGHIVDVLEGKQPVAHMVRAARSAAVERFSNQVRLANLRHFYSSL